MEADCRFLHFKQFDILNFELLEHTQFLIDSFGSDFAGKQCINVDRFSLHCIISNSRTYCLLMGVLLAVLKLSTKTHYFTLDISLKRKETVLDAISEYAVQVGICLHVSQLGLTV